MNINEELGTLTKNIMSAATDKETTKRLLDADKSTLTKEELVSLCNGHRGHEEKIEMYATNAPRILRNAQAADEAYDEWRRRLQ